MKRLLSIILALVLVISCLSFAACNAPEPTEAPTAAPTEAPTQAPTEAPTEAPTQAPTQTKAPDPEEEFEDMLADLIDAYAGKRMSVFGDSISTFGGISNSTKYNTTIGGNAVYYSGTNCGLTSDKNTYWGRMIERVGLQLCVNNSWSGDALRSGRFLNGEGARAKNLHRDTAATPINPDIIFVYFGINDVWAKDATKAQPNGNLNELMENRGDKTEKEVFDEWFSAVLKKYEDGFYSSDVNRRASNWDEMYALLIHTITTTYPDAKVVCLGLTVNKSDSYKDCYTLVPQHNESITHITKHFEALYVDQYSVINENNMTKYMGDGGALHPNDAGHGIIFKALVEALYKDLKGE